MARVRNVFALVAVAFATATLAPGGAREANAQQRNPPATATATAAYTTDPLQRALDAEDKGDPKRASVAYRDALQRALIAGNTDGERIAMALLGLERTWAETGMRGDSILPVVQRVLQ